jgi:hypothetical protein
VLDHLVSCEFRNAGQNRRGHAPRGSSIRLAAREQHELRQQGRGPKSSLLLLSSFIPDSLEVPRPADRGWKHLAPSTEVCILIVQ